MNLFEDLRIARALAVLDAIDTEMRTEPDTQRSAMQLEAIVRIREALVADCDPLAVDATEYRVHVPENGGETLLVRKEPPAQGSGWAVSTYGRGGGMAWTTLGWQDQIHALSLDQLFCWPDAATAVEEARQALDTSHPGTGRS